MTLSSLRSKVRRLEKSIGSNDVDVESIRSFVRFMMECDGFEGDMDIEQEVQELVAQGFSIKGLFKEIDGETRGKLPCEEDD